MKYIIAILFLVIPVFNLSGQEQPLDRVVVTGTTVPVANSELPSDIFIIDNKYIRSSRARDVSQLLRSVPGVFVDQAGGRGGISSLYLRGADPNFTLILLDGVKLNDPNNSRGGSFDLSTIGTENIERIEIVKGPQSAVYGSDALAGVINIITFDGTGSKLNSAEFSAQTKGGYRMIAESRGSYNSFSHSVSVSYSDDGDPTEGSSFKSPSFISSFGYSTENFEIKSISRFSNIKSSAFPDDSGGPEYAILRQKDERELNQFLTGLKLLYFQSDSWFNNLNIYLTHTDEDTTSPGVAPGIRDPFGIPGGRSDSDYTRFEAEALSSLKIGFLNDLTFGVDTQYENGKNRGILFLQDEVPVNFKEERFTISPLVELRLNMIPDTVVLLGGRLDYTDDFGSEFSPHIGILYDFTYTGTTISANWGEGFKLPSFFALGDPFVGNRELKPETSSSFDIKASQDLFNGYMEFAVSAFYNEFRNLIDFDEGPPPQLINRNKVVTKGVEFEITTEKIHNTWISGNLSYINSNIINSSDRLRNRPEWIANVSLISMPASYLELFASINYVGSFFDSSVPTGEVEIGDYILVNTAITYYLRKNLKLFFEIENLLDQNYQQVVGFNAPGIRPGGGIKWNF